MNITGIITEYNPFHNGHKYHIEETKKITNADYIIVMMSGNFVQRGAPAITDKYTRTKMALESGADVVIELPVCYATASAEFFAYGSISAFHKTNIINNICFGSECGDINQLQTVANFLLDESAEYSAVLKALIRQGISFPAARQKALSIVRKSAFPLDILSSPNNILGIEYLKALKQQKSPIKAYTIQRKGSDYHNTKLFDYSSLTSACALRTSYQENKQIKLLEDKIPSAAFSCLEAAEGITFPIIENDFSLLLYYKLLSETANSLTQYLDVSDDLAIRIFHHLFQFTDYHEFASLLKTKQYTMSRIKRCLLHILLNIKTTQINYFNNKEGTLYLRILGLKKSSSSVIRKLTEYSSIPILTKPAHAKKKLSPIAFSMFEQDIFASHLYMQTASYKFKNEIQNEYRQKPIIL